MRKSILFIYLFVCIQLCVSAHQLDFYDKCNKVALPNCASQWNNITSTDSALYLVGNEGACFISYHNGGIRSVLTGTIHNLNGIQFINNTIGFIWGEQGTLLKTVDAGITWSAINTDTTSTIDKVEFTDANNGFFMVDSVISKTINGGISWTKITAPSNAHITDFHFFDTLIGQICGGNLSPSAIGYIYQTTNGGATWNLLFTDTIYFKKLCYINNSKGYVYGVGNTNPILKETTNSGLLWNIKYSNTNSTLASNIVQFSNQTVFVSNETGGSSLYGSPFFNTEEGKTPGANVIYSTIVKGKEMLYILSTIGVYRYMNGGVLFENITFFNKTIYNDSNPSNALIAGSKVKFKISVSNILLSTLINLKGKIRCYSPYITITDSTGSFGNIQSHTNAWNSDDFEIQLSENIPDNYVPQIELMMGDPLQIGGSWNSIFSFPIVQKPFTISKNNIDDDSIENSYGNNNKIIEPGETTEITPFADNSSPHIFDNIVGQLYSPAKNISIWSDTLGFSDTIRNHYYYGPFGSMVQNIQPVNPFVFTYNYADIHHITCAVIFTGHLNSFRVNGSATCNIIDYNNITYRWATDFEINEGYPAPTAIKELVENEKSNFTLFPNPSNGKFTLKTIDENELFKKGCIEINNQLGELIYRSAFNLLNTETIDISNQPVGIYFLKITSDHSTKTIKMINL